MMILSVVVVVVGYWLVVWSKIKKIDAFFFSPIIPFSFFLLRRNIGWWWLFWLMVVVDEYSGWGEEKQESRSKDSHWWNIYPKKKLWLQSTTFSLFPFFLVLVSRSVIMNEWMVTTNRHYKYFIDFGCCFFFILSLSPFFLKFCIQYHAYGLCLLLLLLCSVNSVHWFLSLLIFSSVGHHHHHAWFHFVYLYLVNRIKRKIFLGSQFFCSVLFCSVISSCSIMPMMHHHHCDDDLSLSDSVEFEVCKVMKNHSRKKKTTHQLW